MKLALHSAAALILTLGVSACAPDLPGPSSTEYQEGVAAFYRGVAAAQVGESGLAEAAFLRVTELAPGEPAGWANLGLIALQRREFDQAATRLAEALTLAPDESHLQLVSGLIEQERGTAEAAIDHLRGAVALDSLNLRAMYLLAQQLAQEGGDGNLGEARGLVARLLEADPGNLVALLEQGRLAARSGDVDALQAALTRIAARADSLSVDVAAELDAVRGAALSGEFGRAATEIAFLQSVLQPLPAYRDADAAVVISPSRIELLMTGFLRLVPPSAQSAPGDRDLGFEAESLTVARAARVGWVRSVWLNETTPLALVAPGAGAFWISPEFGRFDSLPFPGTDSPTSPAAVAALDYDYDFLTDLALAGERGLILLRQADGGSFTDASAEALPAGVARGAYAGAWAADVDLEGDLDLVLGRTAGPPVVLRNRGDGTFDVWPEFTDVTALRGFAWADFDADGDPDAALLDAGGRVHVYRNGRDRIPRFTPWALPDTLGSVRAITAADLDHDATVDLLTLGNDGTLAHLSWHGDRWTTGVLAAWPDFVSAPVEETTLLVADLDNNGDLDVVASTPAEARAWVRTNDGLIPVDPIPARVTGIADVSGDGRLDLLAVTPTGESRLFANRGELDYYSTTLLATAARATGDRRINSFGIGGEIEVRAGLLYQKRVIDAPSVHFGLGDHAQVDVARIIWPNGSVQAEFNLAATNETILTRQRLKGSCPWVFTFDGTGMQFVTDFIWRSALGLRINAQGDAMVIHDEDWIRIRGDQLVPRDGVYDVRITAELWETHFFDHVSLMVVDHPAGTEVFVDERFTLPAPPRAVRAMQPLRPVARAFDHTGADVTAVLQNRDGRYLGGFELGPYQGIAHEHYVEVTLGDDAPGDEPLWLVASGWVYPTDASINVAASQGHGAGPRGLQLEVADGRGGWITVHPDLGFPAGKTKTILIDLEDVFPAGAPRTLRLRTNMEIYWDQIAWAVGLPDTSVTTQRLLPTTAELRYRGFSVVSQVDRSAPDTPVYDQIAGTAPIWRDLVGFHTRFGDVRALNEAVDDRYTIMNAGDELLLAFPAPPPPPDGWMRDFVLIGDGWVKDGDYNTGFSTTVLPLPYHALADYSQPPARLEDDPGYQLHPDDWTTYHTRYVTPRNFHRALVSNPRR